MEQGRKQTSRSPGIEQRCEKKKGHNGAGEGQDKEHFVGSVRKHREIPESHHRGESGQYLQKKWTKAKKE